MGFFLLPTILDVYLIKWYCREGEILDKVLEFENVSMSFCNEDKTIETEVLKDVNFSIYDGEIVCIVGPSGSGKSTILNLISGLIKPTKGSVKVKGEIGYMFQHDHLFEWRNIYKNVLLGLEIKKKLTKENIDSVDRMISLYGLEKFKNHLPSQLSGGMRQRVALIRTLAISPSILLLDEPFGALDYQTKIKVIEDIYNIIKKEKKTAIMVTHDISEAISMADRIIILSDRPAMIKKEEVIDFGLIRSPLMVRNDPKFSEFFKSVWSVLNDE